MFLPTHSCTKVARSISLFHVTARLTSLAALAQSQTIFLHSLAFLPRTLKLVLIAAVAQPGPCHSELVCRLGILTRMAPRLLVFLRVSRVGAKLESSSGLFWVNRYVLIFSPMPWIISSIAGQVGSRTSLAFHKVFRFWSLEGVSCDFYIII